MLAVLIFPLFFHLINFFLKKKRYYHWNGLIIDSSKKNTNFIKNQDYYWKYNLKVENKFINAENINSIISASGFKDKISIFF